jgi:uncharacterized protein (DUF4415 family)
MQNPTHEQAAMSALGLSEAEIAALPRARRGPFRAPAPKVQITLRLSQTLVDQLKATGPGWIHRLEEWLERSARPATKG